MSISDQQQIWTRAVSLFVLVIIFQMIMANVVSLKAETKRRLQHALTGHSLVQISYVLPRTLSLCLLIVGASGMYILQQYFPIQFRSTFGPLLRRDELSGKQLPGAFYFLVGTALTVALTKNDMIVARYAVECLAIADPMASWIGSTIRSPKLNRKSSVAGCLACFVTAWFVGYMMLTTEITTTTTTTRIHVVVGALVCTIAEGIEYGNDNLNIPILTALVVEKLGPLL